MATPIIHHGLMARPALAAALVLAFLLAAQAPLRAQGGPPGRPTTPGGIPRPGGAGPGAAPTTPMEPPDLEAVLAKGATFPNASIINVVLPWYKGITGKRVVLDTNIADNNVQMVFEGPISKPDLGDFITRTLLLNGYVFLETDRADTLKLVMADKMRSEPDRYFREGDVLPDNEEVITYVMNLKCIKPEEAIRVIPQVVQLHPYGALAAVPNASAVIITENAALIRKIIDLKGSFDVSDTIGFRTYTLERADAEKVAEMLTTILEPEASQTARNRRSGGATTPQAPAPGQPPAGATGTDPGVAGDQPVKIQAELRTNRIFAFGRPSDLDYIGKLIVEFDAPSTARTFLKRSLSFVTATDMLEPVQNALSREMDTTTQGGVQSQGGRPGSNTNRSNMRSNDFQTRDIGSSASRSSSAFGGSGAGSGGGRISGSTLKAPDAPPLAESLLIGKTLVVADNERNAIIVSGPPESIRVVDELINQLDMRPRQVHLSTVIGQWSMGDELNVGISAVQALKQLTPSLLGAGSLNPNTFPAGTSATTDQGTTLGGALLDIASFTDVTKIPGSPNGLNLYGKVGESLDLYVNLLETTNKFRVLSRPSIFTANNRKATIQSGQRIPVPTNTYQSSGVNTGLGQSTNIDYRDVVLKLEVIPQINSANEVTLQIAQVNDNIVGTRQIDNNNIDVIGTQEMVTTVTVGNGQTVILGGLITESTKKSIEGIPGLIHIPILKHIFGTTVDKKQLDELLIFIQPQIVDSEERLVDTNVREIRRTEGGEEAVEFAVPEYKELKETLPTLEVEKAKAKLKEPGARPVPLFGP